MESIVIFRDYMEQQAQDHNDLQSYVQRSIDHLVLDAITAERRYAGLTVAKTGQVEVQIAPGRFYDVLGAIYNIASTTTQSMVSYLAAVSQRYVTISAAGQVVETDVEERDFLIDTTSGATEPQAVATTRARVTMLVINQGTESADPQPPALPVGHVGIANILLDATQVVSVTMILANQVTSTGELDARSDALELFRASIEPRVNSLASDLAALANDVRNKGQATSLVQIYQDLARVKERVELPASAVDYGADRFLTTTYSDITNVAALAYDAKVEEGLRFPAANIDEFELDIFSANDPNANKQSGLLLPAFDSQLKMAIGPYNSDLGIAQYGFQTFEVIQRVMSRRRVRYGSEFTACNNSSWWQSGVYDMIAGTFKKDGEVFEVVEAFRDPSALYYTHFRIRQVWVDQYDEAYWSFVQIDHVITGAQVAQSFLVSNDMWLTRIGICITAKAANENIHLTVVELTNGVPDLTKAVLHQTVPHEDFIINDWTLVNCIPTFLRSGKRYALLLTSNANHRIGMAYGQQYVDGTFFYSTDTVYFQGDLTKDMMIQLWGARFRAPQVTIEFEAINLDGGIRSIDILAGAVVPASTELVYEVQPSGSGAWIPLTGDDLTAFAAAPPLAHFRGRFVGTRDVMPAIMLTGSRVRLSRPKLAFKHVSTVVTLGSPHSDIYVKLLAEAFNDTPHDLTCNLRVAAVDEAADVTTTLVLPDLPEAVGRIERTFRFQLGAPISSFRIVTNGVTNSAGNTFHVAERVHWAL